jgi:hypothetical protein
MNTEHEGRPEPSGDQDSNGSLFHAAIEKLAASRGQSVGDALAFERNAALGQGLLTDECLLPDEADSLLTSANIEFSDGRPEVVRGHVPSEFESSALEHVRTCEFCQSLLRTAHPHARDREKFLHRLREEAKSRGAAARPDAGQARPMQPVFAGVTSRTAYWPAAMPVVLMVGAAAFAMTPRSAFTETYFQGWPTVLGAGVAGAGIVALWVRSRRVFGSSHQLRVAERIGSTAPVLATSFGALVAIIVVAGAATYRTDKAVRSVQADAVQSAVEALSTSRRSIESSVQFADFKPCASLAFSVGQRYCSTVDGAPGDVVLEVSEQKADVYWEVRGQRVRAIELALAKIRKEADGTKSVSLASGGETPVSATSAGEYVDGEKVVAIRQSAAVARLAADIPALDERAGKFALIRTSVAAKK